MRVAVLCGGKGTRLGEPIKCLAPVAGRPFMDWKIEQLRSQGAHQIHLICGPFINKFIERYSNDTSITFSTDPQTGILDALEAVHAQQWWCMGDVLVKFGAFWTPTHPTMLVRRDPRANIAGIYLDCGIYFGKECFTMREIEDVPWTINTPEERDLTDAYLRGLRQPV